jgi:hypothetical protein
VRDLGLGFGGGGEGGVGAGRWRNAVGHDSVFAGGGVAGSVVRVDIIHCRVDL